MRLSEIADCLAELEGRDADEIHIRLRNPLFKGMLTGQPGRTRNSPADYPHSELIRARLLLAMFDCGLSTVELAQVNDVLSGALKVTGKHPASARSTGGVKYSTALHSIIRGTEADESWHVDVRFTRTAGGTRRVSAAVRWDGWPATDGRASGTLDRMHGETHLGTLTVPASDLIRPLLES